MRFQCPSIAHGRDHVDRGSPDFLTPRPGLDPFCHSTLSLLLKKKKSYVSELISGLQSLWLADESIVRSWM